MSESKATVSGTINFFVYTNVPEVDDERICPVCTEEAPSGEVHHPHYGGICCYSCRAFFRRANQKTKAPQFKCKKNGDCVIVPKGKQLCKKCRYDKCLAVGMDPKWVLTNEEKRKRFEKFFKKKDEEEVITPAQKKKSSRASRKRSVSSSSPSESSPTNPVKLPLIKSPTSVQPFVRKPKPKKNPSQEKTKQRTHSLRSNKRSSTSALSLTSATSVTSPSVTTSKRTSTTTTAQNNENEDKKTTNIQKNWKRKNQSLETDQTIQEKRVCLDQRDDHREEVEEERLDYVNQKASDGFQADFEDISPKRTVSTLARNHQAQSMRDEFQDQYNRSREMSFSRSPEPERYRMMHPESEWMPYHRPRRGNDFPIYTERFSADYHLRPNMMPPPGHPYYYQNFWFNQEENSRQHRDPRIKQEPIYDVNYPHFRPGFGMNYMMNDALQMDPYYVQRSQDPRVSRPSYPMTVNPYFGSNDLAEKKYESSFKYLSLESQLSNILDSFALASGKLNPNTIQAQDLIANHLRLKPLEKTTIISQISLIALMLTDFAKSQFLFKTLCKEDQAILLKSNIPLYLQYIMGRYFHADTGMDQLTWMLEGQVSIESIEDVPNLSRITFNEYNTTVNWISSAERANTYFHCANNIGIFYPFPTYCNGLIANLLLYYTTSEMFDSLKEAKRISCIFREAKELVRLGYEHLDRDLTMEAASNIGPLINTLSKMKSIFDTCNIPSDGNELERAFPHPLLVNYTQTEEGWLKNQFRQFQAEFLSVVPPKHFFSELIQLLTTGKPVSESHVAVWMEISSERVRRVLKIHPEFLSLSDSEQEMLWCKNHKSATAIGIVQLQLVKNGKDQLRSVLGYLNKNDHEWENQFKGVLNLDELQKAYLHNDNVSQGRIHGGSATYFFDLMKEIAEMISNDQLYQLFVILTLLDTEGLPSTSSFTRILRTRQIYLKLFQRKLMAAGCSFIDYASFKKTLRKIKIFAAILDDIFV